MKIRNGFVSNSSSSSFMLLGLRDTEEIVKLINEKVLADTEEENLYHNADVANGYGKLEYYGLTIFSPYYKDVKEDYCKLVGATYVGKEITEKDLENNSLKSLKLKFVEELKKNFKELNIKADDLIFENDTYEH